MRKRTLLLLVLGLLQMTGDLFHFPILKAFASATAASPAPKVFSAVRGLETFSTRYFVDWVDDSGNTHSVEITPERGYRLRGPYNRRNIYGAVLAYGPILRSDPRTLPIFTSVSRYALCGEAPLLREMGIHPGSQYSNLRLRLEPRDGFSGTDLPLEFAQPCN